MRQSIKLVAILAAFGFSCLNSVHASQEAGIPESFGKDMVYNFDPANYPSLRKTFSSSDGTWNSYRPADFYELLDGNNPVCIALLEALNEPYNKRDKKNDGKRQSAYLTNKYSVTWQKVRPLKPGQRYTSLEHEFTEIDLNNDDQIEWVVNYASQMHNNITELMFWVNSNPRTVYEEIYYNKNTLSPQNFTRFLYDEKDGYAITGWRAGRKFQGKHFKLAKNAIEPRCASGDCRAIHKKFDKSFITYPIHPTTKYDLVTVDGKSYFTRVFYSLYDKPRQKYNGTKEPDYNETQFSPAQFIYLFVSELSGPQDGKQICTMRSSQKYIQMKEH